MCSSGPCPHWTEVYVFSSALVNPSNFTRKSPASNSFQGVQQRGEGDHALRQAHLFRSETRIELARGEFYDKIRIRWHIGLLGRFHLEERKEGFGTYFSNVPPKTELLNRLDIRYRFFIVGRRTASVSPL
jgi:hypothetical protein